MLFDLSACVTPDKARARDSDPAAAAAPSPEVAARGRTRPLPQGPLGSPILPDFSASSAAFTEGRASTRAKNAVSAGHFAK